MSLICSLINLIMKVKLSGVNNYNNDINTTKHILSHDSDKDKIIYEHKQKISEVEVNNNNLLENTLSDERENPNHSLIKQRSSYKKVQQNVRLDHVHQEPNLFGRYLIPEEHQFINLSTQLNKSNDSQVIPINDLNNNLDTEQNMFMVACENVEDLGKELDSLSLAPTQEEIDYINNYVQKYNECLEQEKILQMTKLALGRTENADSILQADVENMNTVPSFFYGELLPYEIDNLFDDTQACIEDTYEDITQSGSPITFDESYSQITNVNNETDSCEANQLLNIVNASYEVQTSYVDNLDKEINILGTALIPTTKKHLYGYAQPCAIEQHFESPLLKSLLTTRENYEAYKHIPRYASASGQNTDVFEYPCMLGKDKNTITLQTHPKESNITTYLYASTPTICNALSTSSQLPLSMNKQVQLSENMQKSMLTVGTRRFSAEKQLDKVIQSEDKTANSLNHNNLFSVAGNSSFPKQHHNYEGSQMQPSNYFVSKNTNHSFPYTYKGFQVLLLDVLKNGFYYRCNLGKLFKKLSNPFSTTNVLTTHHYEISKRLLTEFISKTLKFTDNPGKLQKTDIAICSAANKKELHSIRKTLINLVVNPKAEGNKHQYYKIRKYNTDFSRKVKHMLKHTNYGELCSYLNLVLGVRFESYRYYDMFVCFIMPLYKVSLFFDQNLSGFFEKHLINPPLPADNFYLSYQSVPNNFVFHWTINWLYFFSNYSEMYYLFYQQTSVLSLIKILPIDFITSFLLLLHFAVKYETNSIRECDLHDSYIEQLKKSFTTVFFQPTRFGSSGYIENLQLFKNCTDKIYCRKNYMFGGNNSIWLIPTTTENEQFANIIEPYLEPIVTELFGIVQKASIIDQR